MRYVLGMLAGSVLVLENFPDLFRKRCQSLQLLQAESLAYFPVFAALRPQWLFLDLKKSFGSVFYCPLR